MRDQRNVDDHKEQGGVADAEQNRRTRAPLRLATFGGLEIGMPLAEQVRTGVIQKSESLGTGFTSTFWRKKYV